MHGAFNFVASFFDEVGNIRGIHYNDTSQPIRVDRFNPFV